MADRSLRLPVQLNNQWLLIRVQIFNCYYKKSLVIFVHFCRGKPNRELLVAVRCEGPLLRLDVEVTWVDDRQIVFILNYSARVLHVDERCVLDL